MKKLQICISFLGSTRKWCLCYLLLMCHVYNWLQGSHVISDYLKSKVVSKTCLQWLGYIIILLIWPLMIKCSYNLHRYHYHVITDCGQCSGRSCIKYINLCVKRLVGLVYHVPCRRNEPSPLKQDSIRLSRRVA